MNTKLENEAKNKLRADLRFKRRSLSLVKQKAAAQRLLNKLKNSQLLLNAKHIALYASIDGEINPQLLLHASWAHKKHFYLPVLHPLRAKHLVFCRIDSKTKWTVNQFGISEPIFKHSVRLSPCWLSLVLLPLVAFDLNGNRLGMGGGYYDRTFAFKRTCVSTTPKLIGLAHDFQQRKQLPAQTWDVPLNGVVTDRGIYTRRVKR